MKLREVSRWPVQSCAGRWDWSEQPPTLLALTQHMRWGCGIALASECAQSISVFMGYQGASEAVLRHLHSVYNAMAPHWVPLTYCVRSQCAGSGLATCGHLANVYAVRFLVSIFGQMQSYKLLTITFGNPAP